MFGLFKKLAVNPAPVATPLIPDAVSMEYHDGVVNALRAEITGLGNDVRQAERAYEAADRNYVAASREARKFGAALNEALAERDAARNILREINGMVTPACAGIGRKMAAKAREGLPEFAGEREAA